MRNLTFDRLQSIDIALIIIRIAAGVVLFPHGAQKLLGWWGGLGYNQSMVYFTQVIRLPYLLGLFIILLEFLLPLLLILGLFTKIAGMLISVLMAGIIITVQHQYFFMNWFGTQKGEGAEFFLLMIGLGLACFYAGAGDYSLDNYLKGNKYKIDEPK